VPGPNAADAVTCPQVGLDTSQSEQESSPTLNWPLVTPKAMVAHVAIPEVGFRKRHGVNVLNQRKQAVSENL